jgi:hypothetical protein
MSTGGAILLPLDSYGGVGARGRSGASNSLHPLASEGAAYHHSSGEIILPASATSGFGLRFQAAPTGLTGWTATLVYEEA